MSEDRGFSTREDAGKLGFRYARRRRKTGVGGTSRSRKTGGSGTRVDAGHQKSMTSVENRDPVRKYSPGSETGSTIRSREVDGVSESRKS